MTIRALPSVLLGETVTTVRPRYEGLNINSWIGFKHINYLVEEAVLDHFRTAGMSAHWLFEDCGLCVEIVDIDTRITTAVHTDDLVDAVVRPDPVDSDTELVFVVALFVSRGGTRKKSATSAVRVLLRRDEVFPPNDEIPDGLGPFVSRRIARAGPDCVPGQTGRVNLFGWSCRVPYFYCHFTERLQMSGYLRLLEETVDLFLADRGVSIKRLLDEQRWIPVVTHSSITMFAEVVMEEDLYAVFTVETVFKRFNFTARMDTYVLRDGQPLCTATGRITHAYGEILNRTKIKVIEFDQRLLAALEGG